MFSTFAIAFACERQFFEIAKSLKQKVLERPDGSAGFAVDDAGLVLFVASFKGDDSFSLGGDVDGEESEVVAVHSPQAVVVFAAFLQRANFLILLKRRADAIDKQRAVGDFFVAWLR